MGLPCISVLDKTQKRGAIALKKHGVPCLQTNFVHGQNSYGFTNRKFLGKLSQITHKNFYIRVS